MRVQGVKHIGAWRFSLCHVPSGTTLSRTELEELMLLCDLDSWMAFMKMGIGAKISNFDYIIRRKTYTACIILYKHSKSSKETCMLTEISYEMFNEKQIEIYTKKRD